MNRIMTPLTQMGANITSIHENGCAPLRISPKSLHGISYQSPVASAQVKSAILLAGLYAEGETSVTEPALSRNHTELMLSEFGASIRSSIQENGTADREVVITNRQYVNMEPGTGILTDSNLPYGFLLGGIAIAGILLWFYRRRRDR